MNAKARPLYVIFKGLFLFVLTNVLYAVLQPPIYQISVYNAIFPGRARLPFSNGNDRYVVMIDDVDAMLAAHAVSARKAEDEIRVVFIGDSSAWGEDLADRDSLTGQINQQSYQCNGKVITAYNLGYPHPSILKDLILMEKVTRYQPDLIVWLITLNTIASHRANPFLVANHEIALQLIDEYDIPFTSTDALESGETDFFQNTIVGQRSYLARWIKLQALGAVWLATKKDMSVPSGDPADLSPDTREDMEYRQLTSEDGLDQLMLMQALAAGFDVAGETPILLVNEPMYLATGSHSDVRYNDFYPRWAYDHYRSLLTDAAQQNSWRYLDLWNSIPQEFFKGTPLHLTAQGEQLLMEQINPSMLSLACD